MDLSAIALQGVQQADAQLEQAASRIASDGASSTAGANLDVADLSSEMVALISAQDQFSVNVSTLKTAGEIQKNLIDLMA
jgi:flagellar basal body rod protein FlgG